MGLSQGQGLPLQEAGRRQRRVQLGAAAAVGRPGQLQGGAARVPRAAGGAGALGGCLQGAARAQAHAG